MDSRNMMLWQVFGVVGVKPTADFLDDSRVSRFEGRKQTADQVLRGKLGHGAAPVGCDGERSQSSAGMPRRQTTGGCA